MKPVLVVVTLYLLLRLRPVVTATKSEFSSFDTEETFGVDLSESLIPVCRTTEWSYKEVTVRCLPNEKETYIETLGIQVSRRCCPRELTEREAELEQQVAENCRVLPCQNIGANPRGHDLCNGLPTRYVGQNVTFGNEILMYKEAIREACQIPGTLTTEMGAEAVCCPESSGSRRRISVYAAEPFEFPYVANIFNSKTGKRCGGWTLRLDVEGISRANFLLKLNNAQEQFTTSSSSSLPRSHCVVDGDTKTVTSPELITVIVGTNIALLENRHLHPGFRQVVENHPHPNYNGLRDNPSEKKCIFNDIALLKVGRPLKFSERVQAIRIVPFGFDPLKYGNIALSAGWGIGTNFHYLPHLTKTNLILRSDATCFRGAGSTFPWNASCPGVGQREDQFLCLGGLAQGEGMTDLTNPTNPTVLSDGNSGSPVACRNEFGDTLLCGIVSSGGDYHNCLQFRTEKACRFTRATEVAHFRPFIESIAGAQKVKDDTIFKLKSYGTVITNPLDFRHQVYIISSKRRCSGTLVTNNVVVTAGHCVIQQHPHLRFLLTQLGPQDFKVFVRSKTTGTWIPKPFLVQSIHVAPNFRPLVFQHLVIQGIWRDLSKILNYTLPGANELIVGDIAVLRLVRDVDIETVELAVLPNLAERGIHFPAGISAIALSVARKQRLDPDKLLQHDVRILSLSECRERYKDAYAEYTPDSLLCGVEKHSGGGLCDRYTGGGVVRRLKIGDRVRDVLIGVDSFRACQLSLPMGYTNTRLFTSWIEEVGNF